MNNIKRSEYTADIMYKVAQHYSIYNSATVLHYAVGNIPNYTFYSFRFAVVVGVLRV